MYEPGDFVVIKLDIDNEGIEQVRKHHPQEYTVGCNPVVFNVSRATCHFNLVRAGFVFLARNPAYILCIGGSFI